MLTGVDARLVTMPNERALKALLRGEIAAIVAVGGKPMTLFGDTAIGRAEAVANRLGFVDLAPQAELLGAYERGVLTRQDYPTLIEGGDSETRVVRAVLAVYDWRPREPRHAPIARFVRALLANLDRLKDPESGFSGKWSEVDPRRPLAGWRRFAATDGRTAAAEDVPVMTERCRGAFHAALRRGGIEPSEMTLPDYAARRRAFRGQASSPCR